MPDEGQIHTDDGSTGFSEGSFFPSSSFLPLMKRFILLPQNDADAF